MATVVSSIGSNGMEGYCRQVELLLISGIERERLPRSNEMLMNPCYNLTRWILIGVMTIAYSL